MTTPNYRLIVSQKFPGIAVNGRGRYCVLACNKQACWLTESEDSAQAAARDCQCHLGIQCSRSHVVIDLKPPTPLPRNCPDRNYEDNKSYR